MDDSLKRQLEEIRGLNGKEKEERLLTFAKDHDSPQAYNELGLFYRENGADLFKAIEMFEKALSIQEDAAIYTNLGSTYFTLAQQNPAEQSKYMDKTVDAFTKSAKLNSASYYFLGNLYMPKVNAPFPDRYEKAVSYFMKVEKEKTAIWAMAMKNVGLYYYHEKKDYIRAAAYLKFAKDANPKDKKTANYYEYAFGKVNKRKYWSKKYELIQDQNDVDRIVEEGKKELIIRCPVCKSENCGNISLWAKTRDVMTFSFGTKHRKLMYSTKYHCYDCKHDW